MVAYEFYKRRERKGDQLFAILPERRRNRDRITLESITKWLRMVLGSNADTEFTKIYFVRVEI
jgi:hypothetical protein